MFAVLTLLMLSMVTRPVQHTLQDHNILYGHILVYEHIECNGE